MAPRRIEGLVEVHRVRQRPGETGHRRWFSCPSADLYIWEDGLGPLVRFEFCYGKPLAERMLAWDRSNGFAHATVDDGEASPRRFDSPVAIPDAVYDAPSIALEFERVGAGLEPRVYRFVLTRLHAAAPTAS